MGLTRLPWRGALRTRANRPPPTFGCFNYLVSVHAWIESALRKRLLRVVAHTCHPSMMSASDYGSNTSALGDPLTFSVCSEHDLAGGQGALKSRTARDEARIRAGRVFEHVAVRYSWRVAK